MTCEMSRIEGRHKHAMKPELVFIENPVKITWWCMRILVLSNFIFDCSSKCQVLQLWICQGKLNVIQLVRKWSSKFASYWLWHTYKFYFVIDRNIILCLFSYLSRLYSLKMGHRKISWRNKILIHDALWKTKFKVTKNNLSRSAKGLPLHGK